jgi:hypothetical protein
MFAKNQLKLTFVEKKIGIVKFISVRRSFESFLELFRELSVLPELSMFKIQKSVPSTPALIPSARAFAPMLFSSMPGND